MEKEKRWNIAQSYEREFWKNIADKIAASSEEQLTWYEWKATELEKKLNAIDYDGNRSSCRVLEVGSGPVGIVSYLKWGKRYALDPLGDFYKENATLIAMRDGSVDYITGSGEEIPFPDGHFSIVIIDNVLDHVSAPDTVLNEIYRVLSKDGILYLELNIHTCWGYLLHYLLATLNIDKGHPHSYSVQKIRKVISGHRFKVRKEVINDYFEARALDRQSDSLKAKIKGYSGLSEFIYCAVCSKII